jgi:hypothetical protein
MKTNTLYLEEGVHVVKGDYVEIENPIKIIGAGRGKAIVQGGGFRIKGTKEEKKRVNMQGMTMKGASGTGLYARDGLSFSCKDMTFTQCRGCGVFAMNTKGRLINCVITQCGLSGIRSSSNALIELEGDQTKVDGNGTSGNSWAYGLDTSSTSSTIHLLFPLTKESVSTNNQGGGNYNSSGTIQTVDFLATNVITTQQNVSSSSSSSSSSETNTTQQLLAEVASLRSEINNLRSENNNLRSLLSVPIIDVDNDNKVTSILPPTKTLQDKQTKKRKRDDQPTESLEHQTKKRIKVKVEQFEERMSNSKKETAQVQDALEEAVDELNCIICMDKRKAILLLPCTHLNMCETCAPTQQICPTCRAPITKQQKVYIT